MEKEAVEEEAVEEEAAVATLFAVHAAISAVTVLLKI